MKKLMLTAVVAALAGGAFAANIYDYKASVKYVDFKKITAKNQYDVKKAIWVKVVKSATLTGYLCTPIDCECGYVDPLTDGECYRFGNKPGFLVLQNKASKKWNTKYGLSNVKIMPANLLTEWWTTKQLGEKSATIEAQGYLFAGVGKRDVPDPQQSPFYGLGDYDLYVNKGCAHEWRTAGTQFLFGEMNLEEEGEFIEPFLDHAGFGKAKYTFGKYVDPGDDHPCIFDPGSTETDYTICLTSLSGTLIGGSYACLRNAQEDQGFAAWALTEDWLCQGWDDHKENATSVGNDNRLQQVFTSNTEFMYNVVCGTWSIKANTKIADQCDVLENVYVCGQKIDRNFSLGSFDYANVAKLNHLQGNFACKWFKVYGW